MKVDTANEQTQDKHQKQAYDNTLKALLGKEAKEILPLLVPEACLLSEENIEINRTMLRADLVYLVMYYGEKHILIIELQQKTHNRLRRCTDNAQEGSSSEGAEPSCSEGGICSVVSSSGGGAYSAAASSTVSSETLRALVRRAFCRMASHLGSCKGS